MSSNPILVIGATGKTGRRVAAQLQRRGLDLRAVSRNSEVRFDWSDSATWARAVAGMKAVYITHPGLGTAQAQAEMAEFVKLAAAAGVSRAVLASTPDDGSPFSEAMRAAERCIVDAGLGLTSLRLRWFFQNFSEDFLLPAVLSGKLRLPAGAGREAFVDAQDIADVAVEALTDARHNGRSYDLTGPRSLSFADVASELSHGTGRKVIYVPLEPDAFVAEQRAMGIPEDWAHMLCSLYQDIAHGKVGAVSRDVEAVLGSPARDFKTFVSCVNREGAWGQNDAY
ncbi:MAG: NAD(P)H-binding protein [Comamonas sp.]